MPEYRSGKESRRFIRNLVWVLAVGGLFLCGQGLRYHFNNAQLSEIKAETDKLYVSVLGPDIGNSPFGRLQFEHGKLMAESRIGLDPLNVLTALSRPAPESVRLEGLTVKGTRGRVRGTCSDPVAYTRYLDTLSDDEQFLFSVYKSDEAAEGVTFILTVEPR